MRKSPTAAERLLWRHLRSKRLAGYKFRRQQQIGPYIADFYCSDGRLIIELDGDAHENKETYDSNRQAFLESQGLTVLRFWNSDVLDNVHGVLELICLRLEMPAER